MQIYLADFSKDLLGISHQEFTETIITKFNLTALQPSIGPLLIFNDRNPRITGVSISR
jgi:hypothetical protein